MGRFYGAARSTRFAPQSRFVIRFANPDDMCWNPARVLPPKPVSNGCMMNKLLTLLAVSLSLSFAAAHAADAPAGAASAPTPQQSRMTLCNKDAADKKGPERKAFMKECLSAKPAGATATAAGSGKKMAQQEKMKTCNKEAGEKALKGDERRKFMSSCLKG